MAVGAYKPGRIEGATARTRFNVVLKPIDSTHKLG